MTSFLTAEKLPLGGAMIFRVFIFQKFYHGITFRYGERSPQLRITHYELRIESQIAKQQSPLPPFYHIPPVESRNPLQIPLPAAATEAFLPWNPTLPAVESPSTPSV